MAKQSKSKSTKRRVLDTIHLLISHHEPPFMNRCWHLTFRGHTLHICARCSALLIGIITALFLHTFIIDIPVNPLTFLGAFLLSLPAVIDWSSQTLEIRESQNTIRTLTGFLLGYAVGFVLSSLNLIYYLILVILYSGYTLTFGALAPRFIRRRQGDTEFAEELPPLTENHSQERLNHSYQRDEE